MKKTIAALLAISCVMGAGAIAPQISGRLSAVSIMASAATEIPEAGVNADQYTYPYADTSVYTHAISMVTNTNWKSENGNTYGIYKITVSGVDEETGKKGTLLTEYRVGLKTMLNTELDVDLSTLLESAADQEKATEMFDTVVAAKAKEEVELLDPDKVTVIGDGAFQKSYLKSVSGLENIDYIGKNAFMECTYFTEVTIPENVKYIGASAFEKSGLKTIVVNNDMPIVPDGLCASTQVTDVTFKHPEFVRVIGKNAFKATPLETPIFQNWVSDSSYEELTVNDSAFEGCTSIKSVKMSDNLTILGKKAFKGCTSLADITFGEGTIGADTSCFEGCISLSTINFNNALESLGGAVFKDCTSLQSVSGFPATIGNWTPYGEDEGWGFGNNMFAGCTSLTSVDLPPSVTELSEGTFSGCTSLTAVYKSTESDKVEGTACDPSLELIDNSAFEGCTAIRVVEFANATRLGDKAFKGCSAMESFKVGECKGVTKTINKKETFLPGVGENALEGCSSLKSITLLSDSYVKDTTDPKKNKGYTFKDCTSATVITISSKGMTKTPDGFFQNCSALTSVADPDQVALQDVSILSPSTFENCTSLTSIDMPGLRIIEDSAFAGCTVLNSISASGNAIKAEDYGKKCFFGCEALDSVVTGDIYTIDESAFQGSGITEVDIAGMANGTVVIGKSAFADCPNLTKAKIMSGSAALFSIGDTIFSNDTALQNATYEGNIITKGMFQGCTGLLKVCTNATSIKASAFEGCESLQAVNTLDDKATIIAQDIGGAAFKGCANLKKIPADMATVYDGKENYMGCASLESAEVNSLSEGMFADCTVLKEVTIQNVDSIPNNAFTNCTCLTEFDLSKMQSIGTNAFSGSGLTKVQINDASSIGANAFSGCNGLENVDVTAVTIGKSAFEKDVSLKTLAINTEDIGANAFSGCTSLEATGVTINQLSKTLEKVGINAFANCTSLMGIAIPDNPTIGNHAIGYNGTKKITDFVVAGVSTINSEDSNTKAYADKNEFTFVDITQYDPKNLPKPEPTDPTGNNSNSDPTDTTKPNTGGKYALGDVDGTETIDILDVILVNRSILGKATLTSEQTTAADVDKSGDVTPADALMIMKRIVKIIESFD